MPEAPTADITPQIVATPADDQRYTCQLLTNAEGFSPVRDSWNQINPHNDCPMRWWQWLESWWNAYQREGWRLYTPVVHCEGRLVAALPLYLRTDRLAGRVLRFLGSGEVCTDYSTLIADPQYIEPAAQAIARQLGLERVGEFDQIELEGVRISDPAVKALVAELEAYGFNATLDEGIPSYEVKLPNDWEAHLKTLSRTRRNRARKIVRDMFDTGSSVVHRATESASFDRGFQCLIDLHQRRRNALGEPGCFASERFTHFLQQAALGLLQEGALDLRWIEQRGEPIAAVIDLVGPRGSYHYQSGIAPEASDNRPGWQLAINSLQSAIERGAKRYDFLRGNEPYKESWGAQRVPLATIRLSAPRLSAWARDWTCRSLRQVRRQGAAAKQSLLARRV